MPHFTDRFSQPAPWENPRVTDEDDWQGEPLVAGCTYYDVDGTYVHEDEIVEYIKEVYSTFEAGS